MTLERTKIIKLLYRLGFLEAPRWSDDKLREIAREIPSRFPPDKIPKRYAELYEQLCKAGRTKEFITWQTIKLKLK